MNNEAKNNSENKNLSRKDFLKGMGTTLAGVTLFGGMGTVLASFNEAEAAEKSDIAYPLPYTRIDPDKAAERAYKYYKEQGG